MDSRTVSNFVDDVHRLLVPTLSAKSTVKFMNQTFLQHFTGFWDSLGKQRDRPIELWEWLCHSFTVGNGAAMWGSRCPFITDADLWADFWAMEIDLIYIMFNILSQLLTTETTPR